jgi:hypothetical protein
MSPDTRAFLPHLAVVAVLLDGTAVVALGLHSYPGVVAFAALFALTVPGLYVVAEHTRVSDGGSLAAEKRGRQPPTALTAGSNQPAV